MAAPKITTGYTQPGTKLIVKPNIANYKDTKKYQTDLANFYAKSTDPEAVKYRTDELTKKYGSLKNADGKPLFAPTYIKALAEGVETPESLDIAVTDWATSKMKEATNYDWDTFKGGIDSATAQKLLSSFVKDPSQVDTALTFKSSGVEFTDDEKKANAIKLQDKTAKAEKDTAALENYDPNAGTWDPSKNTQATPFGDVLSGLISGYKNPYAANYVNPLAAVEKPKLTNIQTPFNKNAIPQDLVSLFNSAGTNYAGGTRANPLVRPTLPNNGLVKLTQPSATESAEQLAKPGAPDTTNTTLPVVPKLGEPIVTDTGKVVTPPVVNPPVVNPPVVNPPVVNPPVTEGPWTELGLTQAQYEAGQKSFAEAKARGDAARAAKAAADKLVAEQKAIEDARLAAEKAAADKLEADRQAGIKAVENARIAAEKAAIANTLFQQGNITAMPTGVAATGSNVFEKPPSTGGINETVSLPTNTVVQAVNPTSSNQTVALPSSGPQPINPSNGGPSSAIVGPISAAQNNLGPLNISNLGAVISPQAMNSTAGGVASLVGPQVTVQPQPAVTQQPAVNYTSAPSSQQQLEDQAVNAGYQGDYSDTAAMQGYLNSNAGGVASLVGPQVTVQPQPAVTQQPTSNIVAGVGTNPALRAKVLAAQAANMKK